MISPINGHFSEYRTSGMLFRIFLLSSIGAAGLWQLRRDPAIVVLFLGILLTGFGSAYYHLDPDDRTLFWDRLPMAISFMAILAIAIEERVDAKAGAILLWPLVAIGVFSLYAVALDWRPAALWLGPVLSRACRLPLLFLLFRRNTPAHPIGSSPRPFTRLQRYSSSMMRRFIRSGPL